MLQVIKRIFKGEAPKTTLIIDDKQNKVLYSHYGNKYLAYEIFQLIRTPEICVVLSHKTNIGKSIKSYYVRCFLNDKD